MSDQDVEEEQAPNLERGEGSSGDKFPGPQQSSKEESNGPGLKKEDGLTPEQPVVLSEHGGEEKEEEEEGIPGGEEDPELEDDAGSSREREPFSGKFTAISRPDTRRGRRKRRKRKVVKRTAGMSQEFAFQRYVETLDKSLNLIVKTPLKKVQDSFFPKLLYLANIETDDRPIQDAEYSIYKTVAHYLGIFLLISGFPMLFPFALALKNGHLDHALCFFLPALLSIILGQACVRVFQRTAIGASEAMIISALGWLILAGFGSLPFIMAYYYPGVEHAGLAPLDAFFESMSGYTATGLTMIPDVENYPSSFLLWRSITQWIGGVGVIVLFLSVMTHRAGTVAHKLYSAEGRTDKMAPSVVRTTQRIWGIYTFYTILGVLLLWGAGMPIFDSLNHAMTALATGGFSVKNQSILSYDNVVFELIIVFLMVLGGVPFILHHNLLRGEFRKVFSNIEMKTMFVIITASVLLLVINAWNIGELRFAGFQAVSALTGTGFSTQDLADPAKANDFSKFILTILMVFGGGYGSTSSALKLLRIAIIFYAVWWQIKKTTAPRSAVIPFRLGGTVYQQKEVMNAALYGIFYIFILIFGSLAFMAHGYSSIDSLFEVASALGNVGLSAGPTNAGMPTDLKITLIIEMWVGRLEIFPVLMLILSPIEKLPVTLKKTVRRKRREGKGRGMGEK